MDTREKIFDEPANEERRQQHAETMTELVRRNRKDCDSHNIMLHGDGPKHPGLESRVIHLEFKEASIDGRLKRIEGLLWMAMIAAFAVIFQFLWNTKT